jgi:hypothetical protein
MRIEKECADPPPNGQAHNSSMAGVEPDRAAFLEDPRVRAITIIDTALVKIIDGTTPV